jgi:hypothetical protein
MPQRARRVEDHKMDRSRVERPRFLGKDVVLGLHARIRVGGADRGVYKERERRHRPLLHDGRPDVCGNDRIGLVECRGSGLAELPFVKAWKGYSQITSTKGKITTKAKLIGRRSVAESKFLNDLIEFIVRAGGSGDEELFRFRKQDGSRAVLTARSVRDERKDIAARNGLPPNYFRAHSLRKGSITHMRAQGVTEDFSNNIKSGGKLNINLSAFIIASSWIFCICH